jgi:hypothetical protein
MGAEACPADPAGSWFTAMVVLTSEVEYLRGFAIHASFSQGSPLYYNRFCKRTRHSLCGAGLEFRSIRNPSPASTNMRRRSIRRKPPSHTPASGMSALAIAALDLVSRFERRDLEALGPLDRPHQRRTFLQISLPFRLE